jgi:hypothetical protein
MFLFMAFAATQVANASAPETSDQTNQYSDADTEYSKSALHIFGVWVLENDFPPHAGCWVDTHPLATIQPGYPCTQIRVGFPNGSILKLVFVGS